VEAWRLACSTPSVFQGRAPHKRRAKSRDAMVHRPKPRDAMVPRSSHHLPPSSSSHLPLCVFACLCVGVSACRCVRVGPTALRRVWVSGGVAARRLVDSGVCCVPNGVPSSHASSLASRYWCMLCASGRDSDSLTRSALSSVAAVSCVSVMCRVSSASGMPARDKTVT